MEKLKALLVANRGEIAVRIIRTAKALKIRTIAIYTAADAASAHVTAADEAVLLSGPDSKAYLDGEQIVEIAKSRNVNAVIPGYGFLSENTEFSGQVAAAGMVFVGPSPDCIDSFGIKHTARDLATKAKVPIVPGTQGLVKSEDEAVEEAKKMGFPVCISHCQTLLSSSLYISNAPLITRCTKSILEDVMYSKTFFPRRDE